jgi:acyl carrier protein
MRSGDSPAPSRPQRLERLVTAAWEEVLGLDAIGLDDDFFELGGNSLHAVRIVARLEEDLAADLSVRTVLESRSVRKMAGRIGQAIGPEEP